jgi:hypothetical protein
MPVMQFVDAFAGAINGDVEPPDPFEGMGGVLDGWMANAFDDKQRRPRLLEQQVTLPGEEDQRDGQRQRPEDEAFVDLGDFSMEQWTSQYENARIPTAALAPVPGTDFLMEPHAAAALAAMFEAARADGIQLSIGNTYRDYATQAAAHAHDTTPATPTAPPGTSQHGWGLAVDIANTTDAQFQWLRHNAARFGFSNPWVEGKGDTSSVEPWHWEYGGGGTEETQPVRMPNRTPRKRGPATPAAMAPILLVDDLLTGGPPAFGSVLASLLQPVTLTPRTEPTREASGSVKTQLYNGFMDAGRPDLAKMVNTKDFQTWIAAESGWDPNVTSKYFPGHGVNHGLFQFWEGHPWVANFVQNGEWMADPYTQAKLVARYFSQLTPADIHRYAEEVRAGEYSGWP